MLKKIFLAIFAFLAISVGANVAVAEEKAMAPLHPNAMFKSPDPMQLPPPAPMTTAKPPAPPKAPDYKGSDKPPALVEIPKPVAPPVVEIPKEAPPEKLKPTSEPKHEAVVTQPVMDVAKPDLVQKIPHAETKPVETKPVETKPVEIKKDAVTK